MTSPTWRRTRDGLLIPPILYGTAWKKARTATLVAQALEAGFAGIDTACQPRHYHEPGVGEGLRAARRPADAGPLYLQTKFTAIGGQDRDTAPYDPALPIEDQIAASFAVSCANLAPARPDTLILHSPLPAFEDTLRAWRALEALQLRGEVAMIGISNCYDLALLQALCAQAVVWPSIVQNRFYAQTGHDAALRAWCDGQGILYESFWTLTANTHALGALALGRLADRYRCEPAQILLRHVTQLGIIPLVGTTSAEHMRADLAIFEFDLDPAQMQAVARALAGG
jgi:diketogulonate reductase-like aldo/keto reductase